MLLKGICKKCGTEISLDVGDVQDEEDAKNVAREALSKMQSFSCPGHHVEICSPYPNYWNVDEWVLSEGSASSEEEFENELRNKYKEVLTTDEMHKRDVITSFSSALPITNDGLYWDFAESPKGKRYYFHN